MKEGYSCLEVILSSPKMCFQDLGRYGSAHLGISHGGPLDLHAHCWANFLLEYDAGATTLEISLGNASFVALEDSVIAITGAEMNAKIDGVRVRNWCSYLLKKGQKLKLGYAQSGLHSYLAVKGGFDVPEKLGSSSAVVRNGIGENLKKGDVLNASGQSASGLFRSRQTPSYFIPDYDGVEKIRIILPAGQDSGLSEKLLGAWFSISPRSDRMGINLIAECELPILPGILSEGVALGSIQLPPSGDPIVLLNDRQTQGGYAKIGNVARVDLPLLVQMKPMSRVKFVPVSHEQATQEWIEFSRFFRL